MFSDLEFEMNACPPGASPRLASPCPDLARLAVPRPPRQISPRSAHRRAPLSAAPHAMGLGFGFGRYIF